MNFGMLDSTMLYSDTICTANCRYFVYTDRCFRNKIVMWIGWTNESMCTSMAFYQVDSTTFFSVNLMATSSGVFVKSNSK